MLPIGTRQASESGAITVDCKDMVNQPGTFRSWDERLRWTCTRSGRGAEGQPEADSGQTNRYMS